MGTLKSTGFALALTAALLVGSPAGAGEDEFGNDKKECICSEGGGACQHFLRNPKAPTEDPCWCHRCREFSQHDGSTVPFGWNLACYSSQKESLYLKRHAAAWGITCSDCVQDTSCKNDPENCPNCKDGSGATATDFAGRPAKETVLKRFEAESKLFKKSKDLRVLYNRHFYLVTDVEAMKLRTQSGSLRIASAHEWAHLMLERAEYARREFEWHFGSDIKISKPTGIFIPQRERDAAQIQGRYLGSSRTNILYGGNDTSSVADGFCFHGFCASLQRHGSDDADIHMVMRHMIGHELISCWVKVGAMERDLPVWLSTGVAHWLARLQPRFAEMATACNNEGEQVGIQGKGWERELAGKSDDRLIAIEALFGKTALNQFEHIDHKRCWSYFDVCLREWREPFVKMLRDIRAQRPSRDAFMEHLKCTPEIFDERWRERITGRRKSMDPSKLEEDPEDNEDPTARERRALLKEEDLATLAARVRALGTVDDSRTMKVLVDLLERESELVRTTIQVAMQKTADPAVQEVIWKYGLGHKEAMCRAYCARVTGKLGLTEAIPSLRELLSDKNWLVRAEAAVTLGTLKDVDSMARLRELVDDSAHKTRVAAMDSLAMFGEDAFRAVPGIQKQLGAGAWQLRVVAAQSLGQIGSMEAVEDLITRMEVESGRLRKEYREALKLITRDDLGENPKYWREWWEKMKVNTPGKLPDRPPPLEKPPEDKEDPDSRYAKQQYYGIELYTNKVAFVLDTSGSMLTNFTPDPTQTAALSRQYSGSDKLTICKEEIAYALKALDPRSHFNLVTFGTDINAWKKNPVPASDSNKSAGVRFLVNQGGKGETNYYGALRAALDLGEKADSAPNFGDTPDTLTFLTDGMPTRGEITDADTLLEWYTALNRYSRVTTHVIAFGDKGVDLVLLRGMAERNGGKFVHVRERR